MEKAPYVSPEVEKMSTRQQLLYRQIDKLRMQRDAAGQAINQIAERNVPDFHFLDWWVSTFWPCSKSPVGWCIFPTKEAAQERDEEIECRYCGNPVERK